jgi:hypothetical protein
MGSVNLNDSILETDIVVPEPTIKSMCNNLDQDFTQRMNVATILLFEFYRVIMGTMFVIMVPQKCDNHVCSMTEITHRTNVIDYVAISMNLATLVSMCILYYIEVNRENKLISYLDVNISKPRDNSSVGLAIEHLESDKKQSILNYDKYYYNAGILSIGMFVVNSVISIICIHNHYLDSKTATVLLTNMLFMSTKLADVLNIVNTEINIFFSAYLKRKVQFNDIDHICTFSNDGEVIVSPNKKDIESPNGKFEFCIT